LNFFIESFSPPACGRGHSFFHLSRMREGLFFFSPLPLAGGAGGGCVVSLQNLWNDTPSPNPSRKREGNKIPRSARGQALERGCGPEGIRHGGPPRRCSRGTTARSLTGRTAQSARGEVIFYWGSGIRWGGEVCSFQASVV